MQSILRKIFVQNVGFGDNIWAEPIVRHFLAQGEEVLIQTPHPSIFDHYPSSRLFVNDPEKIFPLLHWPILLKFEEHPQMHYLACFQKQAGIAAKLSYPQLHLSEEEKKRKIPKKYAIFHLEKYNNESNFRNVYGIDWKKVVKYVQAQGLEPIQISKKGCNLIAPWFPTLNFREVISLIFNSSLFIGLDSGPSHIAASMQIPSVIFFGSVNPLLRHLDSDKKVFLQNACPFAHCYHDIPNSFGKPCRIVSKKKPPPCCIQDADRVIKAVEYLLK